MNNAQRYVELLKKALINELYIENEVKMFYIIKSLAEKTPISNACLVDWGNIDAGVAKILIEAKTIGATPMLSSPGIDGQSVPQPQYRNFLEFSHSMIGRKRMDNLHNCIEKILEQGIPGDFIETGVWRGGATIFMRGVLVAHGVEDRNVWVADSFEGLPPPVLPQDHGMEFTKKDFPVLAVGLDQVKSLFERYDLLDSRVRFLKGWFRDTLPDAPIGELSLLRLDGDLYESTMDALTALYDKLVPGGFVIVDDYKALDVCQQAVDDFRRDRNIDDQMIEIDPYSVYWRKS